MQSPQPHRKPGHRRRALSAFLDQVPRHVTLLLDEAHVEFARDTNLPDTPALLDAHPNLLVLRTFSKAYGLAALRDAGVQARYYPGEGLRLTVGNRNANDTVLTSLAGLQVAGVHPGRGTQADRT
ncbi:aminotransferase class I/II-fold pyridoxal phosphate-dependent enzyme [Streptomyces sp. NPDC001410]|uniref:aminotransferase class I/II-fold pyridoxal phosphate-dependent enzyme n=1 Tax=Streptomyces sp. NPDC001410 TaxID=3364574 RepID=UPI0036C75B5E